MYYKARVLCNISWARKPVKDREFIANKTGFYWRGIRYQLVYLQSMGCKALTYQKNNFLRVAYRSKMGYSEKKRIKLYPFGLQIKGVNNVISAHANSMAERFAYNGKESNPELGLEWYDFSARNYDAALGRWMNIDPLAEKYYDYSTYTFVMNSPIVYIDPDGKQIDSGSQKEWDKQKKAVIDRRDKLQNKINKLNTKASKKGWSASKLASKIGNLQDRVTGLNDAITNLGVLESSKQVYSLNSGATQNEVSFDNSTGNIVISYSGTALFTHETKHAGQFETGDIAFDSATGNTLAQDVYDEVESYVAQWSYDPSSVGGLKSKSQITASWVQNVTDATGNKPYQQGGTANTGISPVNVKSTRKDLIKAYPHLRSVLQNLPANATLKSIVPTIYTKIK